MLIQEILDFIGEDVIGFVGDRNQEIARPDTLQAANRSSVAFYSGDPDKLATILQDCKAGALLCSFSDFKSPSQTALIFVSNPRLSYIRVLKRFFEETKPGGIHPTAVISESAKIGRNVYIGQYAVIDADCVVGANSRIESHVRLYRNTRLGANVIVDSNSSIGGDGFGYERSNDGTYIRFPHFGGVLIEDGVEIGTNTSIDRGTLGDTIIGAGSMIDNQVHIAHNVQIGKNCIVIAHAMIGGSTKIGDNVWISPSAVIRNNLSIGSRSMIGMASVVVKDVEPDQTVMGAPARPSSEFKDLLAQQRALIQRRN